jgi:hypothetical protein
VLRDGTHPLAVGPVNPGLCQDRADQTGSAGGCQKNWDPADRSFRKTTRAAPAESEVRPGPRLPTLRARHVKIREAAPEALPTVSLPNPCARTDLIAWGYRVQKTRFCLRPPFHGGGGIRSPTAIPSADTRRFCHHVGCECSSHARAGTGSGIGAPVFRTAHSPRCGPLRAAAAAGAAGKLPSGTGCTPAGRRARCDLLRFTPNSHLIRATD